MIKEDILNRIEKEKIKPRSRWSFLLREWLVWVFAGLSFVFGALSVSILIFAGVNQAQVPVGIWSFLPYIWIFVLLVFMLLLYYNIKNSDQGYKFRLWVIGVVSLFSMLLAGIVFYVVNTASYVDYILGRSVSYESVEEKVESLWNNPQEGYLSGLITKIDFESEFFEILDGEEGRWVVSYKNISYSAKELLRNVDRVRVIGQRVDDRTVEACVILPWHLRGGFNDRRDFSYFLLDNGVNGFGKENIIQNVSNERIQDLIRSNKCK